MAVGSMSDPSLARSTGLVVVVACLVGVLAALSGVSPTGNGATDAIVTFVFAAAITWFGARVPWWTVVATGLVTAGFVGGSIWIVPAVVAAIGAIVVHARGGASEWVTALFVGMIVLSLLHLEGRWFFGSSAIVAGAIG